MHSLWIERSTVSPVRRHGWATDWLLARVLAHPLLVDSVAQGSRSPARCALMNVRRGRPIDQEAEQFRTAVMTARVHEPLAGVDLGEVQIRDHVAFTSRERSADEPAIRPSNRREAATGYRPDGA